MYKIVKFPLVFDAIDYTHVRIQPPGCNDTEINRNRKE